MSAPVNCAQLAALDEHARKVFTPDEATRSLVLVRSIVADVVIEHSNLLEEQETIEAAQNGADAGQMHQARQRMLRSVDRLRACMKELDLVGGELLDWSLGVVDFPAVANGREIRLCWQYGEHEVTQWHEVGEDCGRRRRIDWTLAKARTTGA